MNDISKLVVGFFSGIFVVFGLYYGVILKREYNPIQNELPVLTSETDEIDVTTNPDATVTSQIYSNPETTTFSFYSQKIDLPKEFNKNDELTVFVPSNEAFKNYEFTKKIEEDDTQGILNFLNNHIVRERIEFDNINLDESKSYKTISGLIIVVKRDLEGNLLVNNKKINSVENIAKDGIFYILDFVIDKSESLTIEKEEESKQEEQQDSQIQKSN